MSQKANLDPDNRGPAPASRSGPAKPEPAPYVIMGRCLFEDGTEHACEAHGVTPKVFEIGCRAVAPPGSTVIVYLDNVGIARGRVGSPIPRGFRLLIEATDERRSRIAARLGWHAARAAETAEQRAATRIVPINRKVEVRLGDELIFEGRVIDLSMTGAAIATQPPCRPYVGSVIRIGKRYALVVRILEVGFAVQFKLPFIRETFNEHVIL